MCPRRIASAAFAAGYWPLVLAPLALVACGGEVRQPVDYNHSVHVHKAEATCDTCHVGSMEGVVATLPDISICGQCHTEPQGKSPEEAKVVAAVKENKEIPWERLYQIPRHVFFSHRRHVDVGKIACERCHGKMGDRTTPPPAPLMALTMKDCIACHTERGVSTDCDACHR